jgi:hypothetical protein
MNLKKSLTTIKGNYSLPPSGGRVGVRG